jgi:hypothetical protein
MGCGVSSDGGEKQPVDSGREKQPVDSGGGKQPVDSGGAKQLMDSGGDKQLVDSGGEAYGRPDYEAAEHWIHLVQSAGMGTVLRVSGNTDPDKEHGDKVWPIRGNALLAAVPQRLNLVTAFGAMRGGKSTVMGALSGVPGMFAVSGQSESFTKGMQLGNHFPSVAQFGGRFGKPPPAQGSTVVQLVGFVDAEGTGGNTDKDYEVKLIAGPLLLSQVVVFNWHTAGLPTAEVLDHLAMFVTVADKYKMSEDKSRPTFGHLHIVFARCTAKEMEGSAAQRCEPGASRRQWLAAGLLAIAH